MAKLRKLYQEAEDPDDWDELAERLGTSRTRKMLQSKLTELGLRTAGKRAAAGPAWDAAIRRYGTKDKKRKRASPAAPSPVHDEPPRSPDKRAAADVARNRIQMQVASPGESPHARDAA